MCVCVRVSDPPRLVQNDGPSVLLELKVERVSAVSRAPFLVFCKPYGEKLNPTGSVKGEANGGVFCLFVLMLVCFVGWKRMQFANRFSPFCRKTVQQSRAKCKP